MGALPKDSHPSKGPQGQGAQGPPKSPSAGAAPDLRDSVMGGGQGTWLRVTRGLLGARCATSTRGQERWGRWRAPRL